ncbi:DUF968 domain-containing protein [Testudinibacter sp. TR-2022]|uniref:DUF968 domain-containing protein n=1 Tax=Testudinibacter sp. TR-2022 TaxID=2585029 RepID=UPI00111942B3|nr:DUF968 domain-containing protein [Testudinibacter sp. TR-2022]TNH06649.1 DUF968 domain-containing protein [Pasteurellaceae bacterium Phil11]TNH25515.1 DUF968 domain-containing protein [Testudinibacter sp. TR-2022]TNH25708.1 DUF968 domain-containing protein [Testudinibacter sp. TR-2022]
MTDCLLLTPYVQNEVGIAFVRMPKDSVHFFKNRILIIPAPAEMDAQKSGSVKWQGAMSQTAMSAEVVKFIRDHKVRLRVGGIGGLQYYVSQIKQCQLRDSDYCHQQLTVTEIYDGMIRTCWWHDTEIRAGRFNVAEVKALVAANWDNFVAGKIKQRLAKAATHTLTFADITLWAILERVTALLPEAGLRHLLHLPPQVDLGKESTIGFETYPHDDIQKLAKPIVELVADGDPPAQYMLKPKPLYFRSEKWLRWVKSQPCVCCGQQADDPHHLIGQGSGIMGGKADDLDVIPLCRQHHDELHRDPQAFEVRYGSQKELWHDFFIHSIKIGAVAEWKK